MFWAYVVCLSDMLWQIQSEHGNQRSEEVFGCQLQAKLNTKLLGWDTNELACLHWKAFSQWNRMVSRLQGDVKMDFPAQKHRNLHHLTEDRFFFAPEKPHQRVSILKKKEQKCGCIGKLKRTHFAMALCSGSFFFCLSSLRACHSLIFQLCGNPLTGLDLEDKADNIRVNTKAWGLKNWDSVPKGSSWGALRWGWHGTSSIGTLESFEDSTAENSGGLKRKMDLLGSTGAPEWWPRSVFCGDLSIGQAGFLNSSDEKPNPDLFPLTTVVNCIICCEDNLTLFTLHSFYGLFSVFFFCADVCCRFRLDRNICTGRLAEASPLLSAQRGLVLTPSQLLLGRLISYVNKFKVQYTNYKISYQSFWTRSRFGVSDTSFKKCFIKDKKCT